MKTRLKVLFGTAIFGITLFMLTAAEPDTSKKPTNVILLIGDGMGLSQITSARLANNGQLNLDRFKHMGMMQTLASNGLPSDDVEASNAIASGQKIGAMSFGVNAGGDSQKNLLELAKAQGKKTGIVATGSLASPTPMSFFAHGKAGTEGFDVLDQFLSSTLDMYIGGGSLLYQKTSTTSSRLKELKFKGFTVYDRLKKPSKIKGGRVAVFAAPSSMAPVRNGRKDYMLMGWQTAENLLSSHKPGFMLVMEGSQISAGSSGQNREFVNTELIDFDVAVGEALDFARRNQNTLVVVLGDREVGGMTLIEGKNGSMSARWSTAASSGTLVPVYAYGPGAAQFTGVYDNTEVYTKLKGLIAK